MQAWTQPILWASALTVLFLVHSTAAAPLTEQTTEIEYYPVADSTGCYYNFQHYDEGDRIITNEPCLNCTCHNRMLMCYLRVCPFTKAIGQDCTVEKRPDQCCPVITCPEVPVQLLTSTTTESSKSTDVGHPDTYGCSIDNLFYSDGARVPSHPNKPCELCYCIRNKTACVMQECTLKIEGCKPVYQEGVCCPVKYDCDYPEDNLLETTVRPTPAVVFTTTTLAPGPVDCIYNNEIYADGALVKKDIPCEHCYCMKGDIVCAVQECGPTPLDKVNCTALPTREGQCCPDTYDCENAIEEITTEAYEFSTTPALQPVVSEEEASSAAPSPAVTSPPQEAATISDVVPQTEQPVEAVTAGKEAAEIPTSSALPEQTEAEEPVAFATTHTPLYEKIPSRKDEGYDYPKPARPGLEFTPSVETTTQEEISGISTVIPAEVNKERIPSGEQITESIPAGEIEKEQLTTLSPSLEDREKEHPSEAQTVETPVAETEYTTKEQISSRVTTSQIVEQTTLPSVTEVAVEQEATAGTALPTIQPSELPEEGAQTTAHKLPELTTISSATQRPQSTEEYLTEPTEKVPEERTTIKESVETATEVLSEEKTTLKESVEAATEASLGEKTTLKENEEAATEVSLAERTTVRESVEAATQVSSVEKTTLSESVEASTEISTEERTTLRESIEAATAVSAEKKTTLPEKEIEVTEKATAVPEDIFDITTAQPAKESVATVSSEQPSQPELTTVGVSEESTEAATEASITKLQEPLQTTQQPAIAEPTTAKEEISEAETELPHAAATVSEAHVTAEPETSSETIEPSHDQIPEEEEEEEEEEEGSGAHTEQPVAITEESKGVESTEAQAITTEKTASVVTVEVEQEGAPTAPVTESTVHGSASTEEHLAETATSKYSSPEAETVTPSLEFQTTQQPTVVESETQRAQETKPPSELTPASSSEEATIPSVTEEASIGTTVEEHVTEAEAEENLIPGEGSCLVGGQTYSNNSSIPPVNKCHVSCKCVSSIVQCESISCSPPPPNADNCTPVFDGPHTCCPTYSCTSPSSTEIESDSHKMQEATTVSEELTTAAVSLDKYTTEESKEGISSYTTAPIAEEFTPEVTEPATQAHAEPEGTTVSHVSEEIQTTEQSPISSSTVRKQEEPEVGGITTESVPVTEAVEENEIPVGGTKETERPQEVATTTVPEKVSPTEAAPSITTGEIVAEGVTTTRIIVEEEAVTPSEEKAGTSIRPPLEQPEVSSVEPEQSVGTEKLETATDVSQTTAEEVSEAVTVPITSSTAKSVTEAAVPSVGTTLSELEGVTSGEETVSVSSERLPSKEEESEVTAAPIDKTTTTEGVVEPVTEIVPPKEMGKPESHVTESARRPTAEIAASEPVTTEVPLSSSHVPLQEHIPSSSSAPEVPDIIHDGGEQEEGIEAAVTTEAAKKTDITTESIKEIASTVQVEVVTSETHKESTTEVAAAPSEAAKETEAPKDITTPTPAEEVPPTQPSKAVTLQEADVTEPEKAESVTEVTSPQLTSTEPTKESVTTEASKEVEATPTEIIKEVSTESFPAVATTLSSTEVPETVQPHQVQPVESETTETAAAHTEPPQEEASPEIIPTEQEAVSTELPKTTKESSEVKTEEAPRESSTEVITEATTVASQVSEATEYPEPEVETHTEVQLTTSAPSIPQQPSDDNEILHDHVVVEEGETMAPEIESHITEAEVPVTTERLEGEIESATRKEITASAPYETTAPSIEEISVTTIQPEFSPETEAPIKEEIPEVTERIGEATTYVPAEITEIPTTASEAIITTEPEKEKEEEQETAVPTTFAPITSQPEKISTKPAVTVQPEEKETALPETTPAVIYEETTKTGEPEAEITTLASVTEQPKLPEEELPVQTTAVPISEIQTVKPQLETEATSEAETGLATEPVEVQTEAAPAAETTAAPEVAVTETKTSKPLEAGTTLAEQLPASTVSPPEEAVTSEAVTSEPEEVTSPREQEPTKIEPEVETEAAPAEATTPVPEVGSTEAIYTTAAGVPKEPSLEPETAETHVPESDAKETSTTVHPLFESSTIVEEPSRKPEVFPESPVVTTVSSVDNETAGATAAETAVPEVTTQKEEFSKVTSAVEEEVSQTPKAEEVTPPVTARPEIPGEDLPVQESAGEKEKVPELESAGATTLGYESSSPNAEEKVNVTVADRVSSASTPVPSLETSRPSLFTSPASTETPTTSPSSNEVPEIPDYTASTEEDYPEEEDQGTFGPGTCRYGGKLYMSAQQIPRDDPCDFCFCFRSDIICLQQSCPPPIPHCHEEPIRGFCCPRYECPVSMATTLNLTTTSTTTTTTLPPHFLAHAYSGRATRQGCQIQGQAYQVGEVIKSASGPCLHCTCGGDGQMKCDPKACSPEPMLRQMIAAAASRRRR